MSSGPPAHRPVRRGICDGDDVWPSSLTDDELREIAAIDAETKKKERFRSQALRETFGDVPVYSLAERLRHWIGLVEDTETGVHLHPGEYMTELGCREFVGDKLARVSPSLRNKVVAEVLKPLDDRFERATFDDGGTALGREVKLDSRSDKPWWWDRRPITLGQLWSREPADEELIERRIRNRLIDYLEIVSSFAAQQRYAEQVPNVNVAYEVINQWEDWVPAGEFDAAGSGDVFSKEEVAALVEFGKVWNKAADGIPDDYPLIADVQSLTLWQGLRSQAESTLRALEVRGRLPEDGS